VRYFRHFHPVCTDDRLAGHAQYFLDKSAPFFETSMKDQSRNGRYGWCQPQWRSNHSACIPRLDASEPSNRNRSRLPEKTDSAARGVPHWVQRKRQAVAGVARAYITWSLVVPTVGWRRGRLPFLNRGAFLERKFPSNEIRCPTLFSKSDLSSSNRKDEALARPPKPGPRSALTSWTRSTASQGDGRHSCP
jgi:hypothetical protein